MDKTWLIIHDDDMDSPFTNDILNVPVPLLFNLTQVPLYDNRDDPKAHLRMFTDTMASRGTDDSHMCCLFPRSLKGLASSWFHSLPPICIDDFCTLCCQFLSHFEGSIKLKKDIGDFFSLR